ncbi:hypothetical protein BDR07DRAFT_1397991 [Suillus spraguei]|nr:hypothetical protein BDR07DRAFT_1397991 [Suillus spraguei]
MNSTFVDVRAYPTCQGGKDPKSRKLARKHVYIQEHLVDDWVKASTTDNIGKYHSSHQPFLLLTVFMKLCLIRGLIAAVKLAFTSQDIDVKYQAHDSPFSLANFLSQWNGWLEFEAGKSIHRRERLPYRKLRSIVFSDISALSYGHVRISLSETKLELMAAGDWTAIPSTMPWKSDECRTLTSISGWIYRASQTEEY